MRTAEQIIATRFEKVVKAGMLADPDTAGKVRRSTVDAARAVVLYMEVGEVDEALRVAKEITATLDGTHGESVTRVYESMRKAARR